MKQYLDLLRDIKDNGVVKQDRTGVGTKSVFGRQIRYDLSEGFPVLTTKRIHFHSVVGELIWFLRGDTNIKWLNENGIRIWDAWANKDGDLGPVYGYQWRHWEYRDGGSAYQDQIRGLIENIKTNPDSRRLIVSAWNVADIPYMKLPPCHLLFQFYVQDGKLSCQLYQRSGDAFLGVPFNIASYALLTHMIAQVCDLQVGEFIHTLGDAHIYLNHFDQVNLQLSREPRKLPQLILDPAIKDIDDFTINSVSLVGYDPYPGIKAPVAI